MIAVPEGLRTAVAGRPADGGPDGDTWLASLPGLADELLDEMRLTPDGPTRHGVCAIVIPVRRSKGGRAALKIGWPHPESATEHLALRAWNGRGAVRLLAAEPGRHALLLERLDADRPLGAENVIDACEIVGRLHASLDHAPLARADGLRTYAARVHERLTSAPSALPRRLAEHGLALTRDLPQDEGAEARLLHTDLHDENVLHVLDDEPREGTVEGWLAIDPKAMNAEPAFGIAPLLWNREAEAARAHNLRVHLRLRLEVACEAGGIDPDRARAWAIVRLLDNAWWAVQEDSTTAKQVVTQAISIIKAMQG